MNKNDNVIAICVHPNSRAVRLNTAIIDMRSRLEAAVDEYEFLHLDIVKDAPDLNTTPMLLHLAIQSLISNTDIMKWTVYVKLLNGKYAAMHILSRESKKNVVIRNRDKIKKISFGEAEVYNFKTED